MSQYYLLPLLPSWVSDVEPPVDSFEEGHFVSIDLADREARNLAPSTSREVAILQILGCKYKSCEEHAATALQCAQGDILGLRHGEIMLRQLRLDQDQVVQRDLQSGVAGTGPAKRLLDEGTKGKHSAPRSCLATALGLRELPDNLNHLSSRIFETKQISGGGRIQWKCIY
jgi:hypothetical protein